jgi:enoyl-CoA hydratase/carnithine racemase
MSSQDGLPQSYATLQFEEIKLAHVPASSPTPTKVIMVMLHRPTRNNAYTITMANELDSVFRLLDLDERVKAIVLTGYGKMFCAGADLDHLTQRSRGGREIANRPTEYRDM